MKTTFITILFALAFIGPSPTTQALSPPPDGGYPGGNTAEGQNALFSLGTGAYNTAIGWSSLYNNVTNSFNTGVGAATLFNNTGISNTAVGAAAMFFNTTGFDCTAVGMNALLHNTTGFENTANGARALYSNTTGQDNTAVGNGALSQNNGYKNTAVGQGALFNNTDGYKNTAVGWEAGSNLLSGGNLNVYIGWDVHGVAGEVGHTYISNIRTTVQPVANGVESVTVRLSDGLLGHTSSSARYKKEIKPMADASELLYRLKPVTYCYKKEIDPSQTLDYGLVAEDVAKVDSELAIRNGKGEIESVRYSAVNAMLLNEFLKEHRKVQQQALAMQEQKATIAELRSRASKQDKTVEALAVHVREQDAKIQRVSAQVEVNRPVPHMAGN